MRAIIDHLAPALRRPTAIPAQPEAESAAERRARALLATLTLDEKIGQVIMPVIFPQSPDDLRITPELRSLLADDGIGGYFITAGGADAGRVRAFIAEMQAIAPIPLLIGTDFEGGDWNFLQSAVGPRPAPEEIGATGDPQRAYQAGAEDAALLTDLGINLSFAPTVDVLLNPDSPILQKRTFGATPELVACMAAAYLDGLASGGVAGCLKHFPGLGAATADPHKALPFVERTLAELRSVELQPYRDLLRTGHAPMIMTTHMLMPALDPALPTSVSPTVIHGILRKELGYDGPIISDSLDMGALTAQYPVPIAALLAFKAGTDLLLGAASVRQAHSIATHMHAALAGGYITPDQLDAAVLRLLRFKAQWGILP